MPDWISVSMARRRKAGAWGLAILLRARARCVSAVSAMSSSHPATSKGEYFPLRLPLTNSSANWSGLAKSAGSSGLTRPKRLSPAMDMFV